MKGLLGGKGAGLAEMTNLGLPVPPGFTITTEACIEYSSAQVKDFPPGMEAQMSEALHKLEQQVGKTFGDPQNPLLVSVRSGAKISMPGMMDTVLNLGLNDETAKTPGWRHRGRALRPGLLPALYPDVRRHRAGDRA